MKECTPCRNGQHCHGKGWSECSCTVCKGVPMTPEWIAEMARTVAEDAGLHPEDPAIPIIAAALSTAHAEPVHADVPRMRQWADDHLSRIRYGLTVPDAREHLYQLLCRAHAEGRRQGFEAGFLAAPKHGPDVVTGQLVRDGWRFDKDGMPHAADLLDDAYAAWVRQCPC